MIGPLIALISLDVCAALISAGIVSNTLSVSGATNATPIVLQTTVPHGYLVPVHGVVSGVTGNLNANGTWVLNPIDATHLSLTTFSPQGPLVNSVGSGAYTGGGMIQVALPDGSCRLGIKYRTVHGAPPRITFAPYNAPNYDFESYIGVVPPLTTLPPNRVEKTNETQTMYVQRQVCTESHRFKVWIWAAMNPPQPDFGDFDLVQAIRNQIILSSFNLASAEAISGQWTSQDPRMPQWDARGQEYELILEFQQPVIDQPLGIIPGGTVGELVVSMPSATSGDQTIIQVVS